MVIAFDAKRAFLNKSGLGNYSRSTIEILNKYFPHNQYLLYTTKAVNGMLQSHDNQQIITPEKWIDKQFPSIWRTFKIENSLKERKPDIYHGLSNELPFGIQESGVMSVVTIHDLIFMVHPELYPFVDRKIYELKTKYACQKADTIVAISDATKNDIIEKIDVDPLKIEVAYQTCNPIFLEKFSKEDIDKVLRKYDIPANSILTVGRIEERKNVLSILKAINQKNIKEPFVIIGKPTPYLDKIYKYIKQNNLQKQVFVKNNVTTEDLPLIYQSAQLFVLPSLYEGFGIPLIEAMNCGLPVVTSHGACFAETCGDAAEYVNPLDSDEIGHSISKILSNNNLRLEMIKKGYEHVKKFSELNVAERLMEIYELTLDK